MNFKRHEKMGTLFSNSQATLSLLERIENAKIKFDANAYVHQYAKFGIEDADFEHSFMVLSQCRLNYTSMQ